MLSTSVFPSGMIVNLEFRDVGSLASVMLEAAASGPVTHTPLFVVASVLLLGPLL